MMWRNQISRLCQATHSNDANTTAQLSGEHGQSLVEFAIVVPVLLLLLLGTLD